MRKKIFTTRDIDVSTGGIKKPLKQVTTKSIEVKYIDKGVPQAPKGPMVTTHELADVADIAKKKAEKQKVAKEKATTAPVSKKEEASKPTAQGGSQGKARTKDTPEKE